MAKKNTQTTSSKTRKAPSPKKSKIELQSAGSQTTALQAKLQPLREKIDDIDLQILNLLSQRAAVAVQVGHHKSKAGEAGSVFKPEREASIIRQLVKEAQDAMFPLDAIAPVWTEIIAACRGLESPLTVAYLGPQGSFSEQAALEHLGSSISRLRCESFDEIFRAVESGQAQVGVVPVENSTEGAVSRTLDLLLNTTVTVMGERSLHIHHCLMTQNGKLSGVKRIMGHPQALAQCQGWLNRHAPDIVREAASSNSDAARLAAQDKSTAAIAGSAAADAWGLTCVAQGIQDDNHNRTRFLVIGKDAVAPSGNDKTSLILAVPNRAGAVYEMLAPLAGHGVSMARLESRPARTGQWEYYFYVDLIGHAEEPAVAAALAQLKSQVAFFKLLGSYPVQ